jgi:hypothetical protein
MMRVFQAALLALAAGMEHISQSREARDQGAGGGRDTADRSDA